MISIIVPVYNSDKYLSRCIESILSQSSKDWELFLINDGSTDESGNICDRYALNDSRISVIHQSNKGVSAARNIGIENANGEWITFCDSDDELKSNAIECYKHNITNDIDIIRGGFERIKDRNSTIISTPLCVTNNKEQILSICRDSGYETYLWNTCFRKSIIEFIRFNETISWCEDHLFTFQAIANARKLIFVPDIVYRYYAPIKSPNSFGFNLSSKYIDPNLILREARLEKQIKETFLSSTSTVGKQMVNEDYQYKIILAIRYAVLDNRYSTATKIALANGLKGIRRLCSILFHTRITPIIKNLLNIKPQ